MSTRSSLVAIRRHQRVLGQRPNVLVVTAKINDRARRRCVTAPVNLYRLRAHYPQCGVGVKGFECTDLGPTRAANPPRLLEHAGTPPPLRVAALGNIVIAARCEEPVETCRGSVVGTRLCYGEPRMIGQRQQ